MMTETTMAPVEQQAKGRGNPFAWLFRKNYQFVLAFFIPFGILLIAYLCFGVYPIANRSVLSLDLNGQYVYYFDYMYDVLAGKESLFYSWNRNLSGEFMGIIGYYLASPFNFLVWIFPRAHITEGLLLMLITKTGAIGVCMSIYLYRCRGFSRGTTILFSMMYTLCSYTIVQTMNPMWLDGVMALPLVIYGVESLVKHNRFRLLIGALIYSFVTCFYIGYMIGIFAALYFIYYFFASSIYGKLESGRLLARMGLFGICAVVAVLCSAFMLLPVYNSLSLGKFSFSVPDYSLRTNFHLIDFLDKLLPNSYDTVRMIGLPFIYCGVLTVIMVCCFFFSGSVRIRKRMASAVFLVAMAVCMYITPVDMMWHGGQLPNWLPYRYSFCISFLLVIWGAEAFGRIAEVPKRRIGYIGLALFSILVYLESMDNFVEDLKDGKDTLDGVTVVLPAILIVMVLIFFLVQMRSRVHKQTSAMVALTVLVGFELFYNTITGVISQHNDIVYSTRDSYQNVIAPTRAVVDEIKANDPGFYRVEKNYFRTVNDPMAVGMYGLSHSSSTLNDLPIALLGQYGLTSRSHYTRYSGATPLIDDLFGVKYILSCPSNDTGKIASKESITIEENLDAMPMMYLVDRETLTIDYDFQSKDTLRVFDNQNELLSKMIGEPVKSYFSIIPEDALLVELENVKEGTASGGHTSYKVITSGKNAQVKYTLSAEADGELFMWLPSRYERKLNVWVNETEWKGNYFENDNYCIKSLGEFSAGDRLSVTLTLTKEDMYYQDIQFGYLNQELYTEDLEKLHTLNAATTVEKRSPTHVVVQTASDARNVLFTTLPVEPGWTVTIDGQPAEYRTVLNALIGIDLPEGNHMVEFRFMTAYYPLALYLTAGGAVLFAVMCLLWWRHKRKYGKDADFLMESAKSEGTDTAVMDYDEAPDALALEGGDEPTKQTEYTENADEDMEETDEEAQVESVQTASTEPELGSAPEAAQSAAEQAAEPEALTDYFVGTVPNASAEEKASLSAQQNTEDTPPSLVGEESDLVLEKTVEEIDPDMVNASIAAITEKNPQFVLQDEEALQNAGKQDDVQYETGETVPPQKTSVETEDAFNPERVRENLETMLHQLNQINDLAPLSDDDSDRL